MIALGWDPGRGEGALLRTPTGALAREDGLTTAVLLSLFLDRRAGADDPLPDGAGDRRGWLGDALGAQDDRIGSRLWLLAREKQVEETRRRAEEYAEEALAWLVEDGLAEAVAVAAEWRGLGWLDLRVEITPGFAATYTLRLG